MTNQTQEKPKYVIGQKIAGKKTNYIFEIITQKEYEKLREIDETIPDGRIYIKRIMDDGEIDIYGLFPELIDQHFTPTKEEK